MADLAEILMIEHLVIRRSRWITVSPYDPEKFTAFLSYVKNCHVEIEEKVCFPLLEAYPFPDSADFAPMVRRIQADHKLIQTLGTNIIKWEESGKTELVALRLPLFYRTLVDHNLSEDSDLFPRWNLMDNREIKNTVSDALSIISSFGKKEYMLATGLSNAAFRYIFGAK